MEQAPKPPEATAPQPKSKKTMYAIVAAIIVIIVVVLGLYLTGFFGGSAGTPVSINDDTGCNNPSGSDPACNFSPASVSISAGSKVTWTNKGQTNHAITANTTANGNLPSWTEGSVAPGATFSNTFSTAGTYYYYCSIHPWMKGTVTVS